MPTWVMEAANAVAECQFPDMELRVHQSASTNLVYLCGTYWEKDTVTGKQELQQTRRWPLNPAMSKSEIVATAFKCVLTSMEHRTREWFTYRERAIYQPHYDVDTLHSVCVERVVRDEPKS